MAEKSFLDQAAEYAHKELERLGGDPSKLEVPLQTVAILYHSQAIIDNGGFRYLFENDLPFCPPYSMLSNAYRRIGAHQDADRLEKAVAMFPFESPHLHQEKRLAFMDSLEENDEFFELGDEVCGDKKVWTALEDYAQKNATIFRVM
ncbi:MAG TPA: DUF4375 domain-containing protein [Candidatus Sulfotelmatobacter sp.]|nr:DUF4375 domain-containing protein [Candidatus Sulfotelmatobacter sp.]